MHSSKLRDKHCQPCNGNMPALCSNRAQELVTQLHQDWVIADDGKSLVRQFSFKGFAKSVYLSNLCCYLADRQGHHPDVAFGWGYCQVTLTTHDIDGLSENDFIWAARLDAVLAN